MEICSPHTFGLVGEMTPRLEECLFNVISTRGVKDEPTDGAVDERGRVNVSTRGVKDQTHGWCGGRKRERAGNGRKRAREFVRL